MRDMTFDAGEFLERVVGSQYDRAFMDFAVDWLARVLVAVMKPVDISVRDAVDLIRREAYDYMRRFGKRAPAAESITDALCTYADMHTETGGKIMEAELAPLVMAESADILLPSLNEGLMVSLNALNAAEVMDLIIEWLGREAALSARGGVNSEALRSRFRRYAESGLRMGWPPHQALTEAARSLEIG